MATHGWSGEQVIAEHKDIQANTMAINCNGEFAVLAGRKYIAVVNLDKPSHTIKKIPRQSKWEVGAAQWSVYEPQIFALAYNQRAEIYDYHSGEITATGTLKQHTRAISDIDWAVFDNHVLATASIDTFIHLWDTRDHRRPVQSLSAVAGAVQVKWNKVSPNILATSHEGDVRLWDYRKSVAPIKYLTAHLSKIHGIDWSPISENHLATSGQDCTVKFWDVQNSRKVTATLSSSYPVWKARFTPFGDGLVTVVVPQLRRGENSLILWNVTNLDNPVHTFLGHTDDILEFGWRKSKGDSKDCHLVTWSKDQSLRVWTIDYQLQKLCGHQEHVTTDEEEEETSTYLTSQETDSTSQASQNSAKEPITIDCSTSPPSTINPKLVPSPEEGREATPTPSTPSPSPVQPHNLLQEFSLVNMNIANMEIDEMDASKRSCTVTVVGGKQKVHIIMTFPNSYPYNTPPKFQFGNKTTVAPAVKDKIMKVLRSISQHQVRRNRSCLEPCLRKLVATMESFNFDDNELTSPDNSFRRLDSLPPVYQLPPVYGSFQDASVPFPRTSGARFCGSDILVCFVRPPHLQRINAPTEVTPRSLSALGAYLSAHLLPISGLRQPATPSQFDLIMYPPAHSPTGDPSVSISSFYFQERTKKQRSRSLNFNGYKKLAQPPKPTRPSNSGAVVIYSIEGAIPISKKLAQSYVFCDKDVPAMCIRNAALAAEVGRKDLIQIWNIAALMSDPCLAPSNDPDCGVPFAQTPLGRPTLESIIEHYIRHLDIQTVAMMCCTFGSKAEGHHRSRRTTEAGNNSPGGSPYHTVVPADTQYGIWGAGVSKRNRSNSWSDSGEEFRIVSEYIQDPKDLEREQHEANIKMLDPKKTFQYDQFKKAYAEILYRWNLFKQRAEILKFVTPFGSDRHEGIDFNVECQICKKDAKGSYCYECKKNTFECAVCHVTIRGASNFCLACGHGGHTIHMMDWFQKNETCPSGCGCDCLAKSDKVFGPE